MKENPRHGSGATANDVVIVGATVYVRERDSEWQLTHSTQQHL